MVNDYFKGVEMGLASCEKFALESIAKDDIKLDVELLDKKYWDYKMWHPTKATMYFVHRYHTIAAAMVEREIGAKEASGYRHMASKYDLRTKTVATKRAFWKARQHADAIGCTYDVYIRAAIRHFRANYRTYASVKASGYKQVMPYPAQIATEFVVQQAMIDWTNEKKARFPLPKHVDIPNNSQLWFRPEMEAWIIEEANKTGFGPSYIKQAQDAGIILGAI